MAEEEHEALVAAISHIDAAVYALGGVDNDETSELNDIRNRLNDQRIAVLGNGADRPWWVSDVLAPADQPDSDAS